VRTLDDSFRLESNSSADERIDDQHAYDVLGITMLPDGAALKRIYRELVSQYHPDKVQHLAPEFKAVADQKIREINQAYDFLKNKIDREAR
jgi:DnaJ like chaperone protein